MLLLVWLGILTIVGLTAYFDLDSLAPDSRQFQVTFWVAAFCWAAGELTLVFLAFGGHN